MRTANLLIELQTEELPPKALARLGNFFAASILKTLAFHNVVDASAKHIVFASPRRLGVLISDVRSYAPTRLETDKLVPEKLAYEGDGKPTTALIKKLSKLIPAEPGSEGFEVALGQVQIRDGFAYFVAQREGISLTGALNGALQVMVDDFPSPKRMTYQLSDGLTTREFVRPAHGLVVLHGDEVVEGVTVLGLTAGRITRGHRFEAKSPVSIPDADSYANVLRKEGAVIARFSERRAEIERQLQEAAQSVPGGARPIEDEALLDEVTALVERPKVLICRFEPEFLNVPQECLILTMKANQKYFPLLDAQGRLTHRFLVVSNISPQDPSAVIGGNERVIRPRLADAKFFFDQDRKKPLQSRVAGLAKVVYHNKLGTQAERAQRVRDIASALANAVDPKVVAKVEKAAELAKADLLTDMVGEFPELQGIMGRYYALADGLSEEVADAIEDHYKPRFSGDILPRGLVGSLVALADKLETLVGLFGIGSLPTGDKDPYALRRHALGAIRILVEQNLPLDLDSMLVRVVSSSDQLGFSSPRVHWTRTVNGELEVIALAPNTASLVSDFIYDRLAVWLREQGYSAQEVDAVLALRPQRLGDVAKRLAAVRAFADLPEAPALAAANKRIGNILKKADAAVDPHVSEVLLKEDAEKALYAATRELAPAAKAKFESGDYTGSLQTLAALRAPVDAFFDGVMVNAEEADLRLNRLGLLATLHGAMNRVADLSRLAA